MKRGLNNQIQGINFSVEFKLSKILIQFKHEIKTWIIGKMLTLRMIFKLSTQYWRGKAFIQIQCESKEKTIIIMKWKISKVNNICIQKCFPK